MSRVIPALVATDAVRLVNVFPDPPLVAITFNCAAAPLDVVRVVIPPSPAIEMPGFTVSVIGIEVVAPNESVAVTVS